MNLQRNSKKMTADNLKNSILQRAIQGKLVPQNPKDEPASELLKKISAERQKLIDAGKIKKEKSLSPISAEEIPFDIPKNWQWVRLGDIGETNIGLTYKPKDISNNGTIVLRSGNIQGGKMDYSDIVKVDLKIPDNKRCNKGDILICARNGSKNLVGKSAIINRDNLTFGAFMAVFRSDFNPYILAVINSPHFRQMLVADVGTMTINQITQDMLKNAIIPLPPLDEQKRIVAKLEELMPLIERLGAAEKKLSALDKDFPNKLKKSILQQAIQGKLSEQLPTDGNASDLIEKIRDEKNKLIADGKIKNAPPLPPISPDEIPFDIPDSWQWVRLGNIFNIRSSNRIHQSDWQMSGVPFLRGRELVQLSKENILTPEIFISEDLYQKLKTKSGVPAKDDLLVSAVGTIGKAYVVKGTKKFYYKDAYVLCFENFGNLLAEFIKYAIESPALQKQIHEDSMASTVKQLTIEKSKSIIIPLPPLAEQKRIVAKLEELLPLCDKLAEKISK